MVREDITRRNRLALLLFILGLALAAALMSLPVYRFTASVYTKKSTNTFVGDDKYQEARAEVEGVAEEYKSQGMQVEIRETVTERTNSKGEKTSLVAFSIGTDKTIHRPVPINSSSPHTMVATASLTVI